MSEQRYKNATSDLLWQHRHTIGSGETHIKHMSFTLYHTFAQIPHYDESEKIQLFTSCEYELTLIDKQPVSTTSDQFKQALAVLPPSELYTKRYTLEEWRGIENENQNVNKETRRRLSEETRRRLISVQGLCDKINKYSNPGNEMH